MNLEDIQTVSDLVNYNEQETVADTFVNQILDTDVQTGHEVCVRLLKANIDLHIKHIAEMVESEENDPVDIVVWSKDLTCLKTALDLLEDVDV